GRPQLGGPRRDVDPAPVHRAVYREGGIAHARVHRLEGEDGRRDELHVRHAAEARRAVLVDQRAEAVAQRAEVEHPAEEGRPYRGPPEPPVLRQPAAEGPDAQLPGPGHGSHRDLARGQLVNHQSTSWRPVRYKNTSSSVDRRTSSVSGSSPASRTRVSAWPAS